MENLGYIAALNNLDREYSRNRIKELMEMVGLTSASDRLVEQYSRGMRQRLHIARGLLTDPELLFMDEPTIGLDPIGAKELRQLIPELVRRGKTILLTTHYMTEADELCERLVIIDHGRAIALDTPERLKADLGRDIVTLHTSPTIADPETLFAGLGVQVSTRLDTGRLRLEVHDAESIVGDLVTRITSGHRLESVRVARPSLDDVFLHHTGRGLRE